MDTRLSIIREFFDESKQKPMLECKCECGNLKIVRRDHFRSHSIRSCGCLEKESRKLWELKQTKHGLANTHIYYCYDNMMNRCYNQKNKYYNYYGGKNIQVCQDWNAKIIGKSEGFDNFVYWALKNGYREGLTIERLDNNLNYCPNNCIWIPKNKQGCHTSKIKYYSYKGELISLQNLSKHKNCVVKYSTLLARLKKGWPIDKAIETPLLRNKK